MFRIIVPALCLLAGTASAKDLKVLTGAGMSMPVKALAADFGARTGDNVTVVSDTAGGVQKRMEAGEKFDLVIATEAVMDALTKEGKVAGQRDRLAQMVAGIGARAGSAKPAIADAAQIKATLLAARNITYVDPASGGITGVFFLSQADKLGIGDRGAGQGGAEAQRNGRRRGRGLRRSAIWRHPGQRDAAQQGRHGLAAARRAADDHDLCRRSFQRCPKCNGRKEPAG